MILGFDFMSSKINERGSSAAAISLDYNIYMSSDQAMALKQRRSSNAKGRERLHIMHSCIRQASFKRSVQNSPCKSSGHMSCQAQCSGLACTQQVGVMSLERIKFCRFGMPGTTPKLPANILGLSSIQIVRILMMRMLRLFDMTPHFIEAVLQSDSRESTSVRLEPHMHRALNLSLIFLFDPNDNLATTACLHPLHFSVERGQSNRPGEGYGGRCFVHNVM